MEPETSAPKLGQERAPLEPTPEHMLQSTPEHGLLETGTERTEQASEITTRQNDASVVPAIAAPTTVISNDSAQDPLATNTPAVAADDDLIEKEWVDRAKKIISDTHDDPYKQENAVTALQKDYQRKRYGRELGDAN